MGQGKRPGDPRHSATDNPTCQPGQHPAASFFPSSEGWPEGPGWVGPLLHRKKGRVASPAETGSVLLQVGELSEAYDNEVLKRFHPLPLN